MRPVLAVFTLCAILTPLPAQAPAPVLPVVPPSPCNATASAVEKDGEIRLRLLQSLTVERFRQRTVVEIRYRDVQVGDMVQKVPYEVTKKIPETYPEVVTEEIQTIADGKIIQVTRKDGKSVEPKDLPRLLAKNDRVLYVRNGEMIDPAVRARLDAQTLIIQNTAAPPPPPQAPPAPVPPPPVPPLGQVPPPAKMPTQAPPTLCQARAVQQDGKIQLVVAVPVTQYVYVPRQVVEEVIKKVQGENGVTVDVKLAVVKTVYSIQTVMLTKEVTIDAAAKSVKVTRKDGKAVDAKDLLTLLAEAKEVLVVGKEDRQKLPKLAEGTLVIRADGVLPPPAARPTFGNTPPEIVPAPVPPPPVAPIPPPKS